MTNLILKDVVIGLPEGFVLPMASQPDGQRVADDVESRLAKRTKRSNANRAVREKKKRVDRNYIGSPSRPWNQVGAKGEAGADAQAEVADARAQAEVADVRAQAEAETAAAASASSAGTGFASPRSPPSKKPRRTKVAAATHPPTFTAADVVDLWLAGARLPSALRCAHMT
jgi:hypothetical protein